jgi:hypothetical protein
MGKGKNKTRTRGGELPFTLLFEPPNSSSSTSMSTLGNPLYGIFSDVDRELLDELYFTAGRDAEVAAAMLLEMLPSQARLPDSRSGRGEGQESQSGGGGQDARSGRGRQSVFELLSHDMLLKLLSCEHFKLADLLLCWACCREWRELVCSILAAVKQVDLCHTSDAKNLALLRACSQAERIRIRGSFKAFEQLPRGRCHARSLTKPAQRCRS